MNEITKTRQEKTVLLNGKKEKIFKHFRKMQTKLNYKTCFKN